MTGQLKDILTEQARQAGEPDLDLDAVVAAGARRVRRRRTAGVTAVAAAGVVAIAAGVAVVRVDRGTEVAQQSVFAFTERRPTYAVGGTIHFGSEAISTGPAAIASFVQTDAGFVYAGADGTVSFTDGRSNLRIGGGNKAYRLAADDTGTLVGWVDARPAVPEFVVYDVAAGREVVRTAAGNRPGADPADPDPVSVRAIDDGHAYFAASDGLRRWDLEAGRGELLKANAPTSFLRTVRSGRLVWEHRLPGDDYDLAVGTDLSAPTPAHFPGWDANLSPGGKYLMTDAADEARLFSVEDGRELDLQFPGYPLIVPTQWAGDTSFYALGYRQNQPVDLLSCSTTTLRCEVRVPAFAPLPADRPTFQVPVGQSLGA